jgi:hypothetical protein
MSPTKPRLLLEDARTTLSRIWFIGSGVNFLILLVQSLLGKYGSDTQQVWSWFIPSVVPTLSLVITVLGVGAMGKKENRFVKTQFVDLAKYLSIAYMCVLFLTIVAASLRPPAIDVLLLSNAWLGPLQGLTVAAIGYLFIAKHAAEEQQIIAKHAPEEQQSPSSEQQ